MKTTEVMMENRTARLTILVDPDKKEAFEALCNRLDITPSQALRQMIRDFLKLHHVTWPIDKGQTNDNE